MIFKKKEAFSCPNNENARIMREICSNLTIKISKRRPDGGFCENS